MSKKKGLLWLLRGHHAPQEYLDALCKDDQFDHERWSGSSHVHVFSKSGGRVDIPMHSGDMATGTEYSIRSQMRKAGFLLLLLIPLAAVILWLLSHL